MVPEVRDILQDRLDAIETLEGDDDREILSDFFDQIRDVLIIGDVFDTDKSDLILIDLLELLYKSLGYQEIRVKGDDCFVVMLIDVSKSFGFDVGVDEEHGVGVSISEGIELLVFCISAVEVIVDTDADYVIEDSLFHDGSLYVKCIVIKGRGGSI